MTVNNSDDEDDIAFQKKRHIQYFVHNLKKVPHHYTSLDTNRLTLIHFAVQSLDILGFFDTEDNVKRYKINKKAIIDWIYSLQTMPSFSNATDSANANTSSTRIPDKSTTISSSNQIDDNQGDESQHEINCLDDDENDDDDAYHEEEDNINYWRHAGFKGGTFLGNQFRPITPKYTNVKNEKNGANNNNSTSNHNDDGGHCFSYEGWKYDHGHIAMTYSALCTLATLGDDLSRVNRPAIIKALGGLQLEDGSFRPISIGSEHDMRFVYCACALSYILNDWSGVNIPKVIEFIQSCHSWDGAFSLIPGQEGHGGSSFCAVASLALMGKLDDVLGVEEGGGGGGSRMNISDDDHVQSYDNAEGHHDQNQEHRSCIQNSNTLSDLCDGNSWKEELIYWCVKRQIHGMQGRPNKREDTCYSFWIGGTLTILGYADLLDEVELTRFVLRCQTSLGGFSKFKDGSGYPDLLHSFYSLAWLSLSPLSYSIHDDTMNDNENRKKNDIILKDELVINPADFKLYPLDVKLGVVRQRGEFLRACFQ